MTSRLILPLYALGAAAVSAAPAPLPLLWPQVAFVPPGTNATVRTDVVGGAIVAVPGAVGPAAGPAGAATGPGAVGIPGTPGFTPGRTGGPGAAPGTSSPATPGQPGASASGSSLESPACSVVATSGEYPVSAFGGIVEVRVNLKPSGCQPTLGSSGNWLLLAPGPQGGNVFRFSVSPNLANAPRTGVVVVGSQKILIQQAANGGARFAASPGHVSLNINNDRAPSPRIITIFSDDKSLTYSAVSSQPWLTVTPGKSSSPGAQRFQIVIDPARLRPGRNEAFVRITAVGQLAAPVNVPVVVEVPTYRRASLETETSLPALDASEESGRSRKPWVPWTVVATVVAAVAVRFRRT